MEFLLYSENILNDLLTISAILAAIVLVFSLLIMTISFYKNDKVKRQIYKEIFNDLKYKKQKNTFKKDTNVTLEL